MTKWEYATVPLLIHATKQILDQWGEDGWELVTVLPGPTGEQHGGLPEAAEGMTLVWTTARRAGHRAARRRRRRWRLRAGRAQPARYVYTVRPAAVRRRARSPRPARSAPEISPEEAKAHARTCALNALAAVHALVGVDSVVRVVKVVGFVASAEGFTGQPAVVNGASELFGEVFGDAGGTPAPRSGSPSCRSASRSRSSSSSPSRSRQSGLRRRSRQPGSRQSGRGVRCRTRATNCCSAWPDGCRTTCSGGSATGRPATRFRCSRGPCLALCCTAGSA